MVAFAFTRRRIVLISAAAALLAGGLGLQPLAVHLAQSAARSRGWSMDIRHAVFGTQGLWFKGVSVARQNVPELHVKLDAVLLPWSKILSRNGLVIVGGHIALPDQLETLQNDLSSPGAGSHPGRGASRLTMHVSGLNVFWPSRMQNHPAISVWGISGDIAPENAALGIDRFEATRGQSSAVFEGMSIQLDRSQAEWRVAKSTIERASLEIRSHLSASVPSIPPKSVIAKTASKPGKVASGSSPSKVECSADVIERFADSMSELQRGVRKLRENVAQRLSVNAALDVTRVNLKLVHGAQSLNMGPFQLRAHGDADGFGVVMEQGAKGTDERRYVELRIPVNPSRVELKGEIGFVSLQELGVKEADFGLAHVDAAKLKLNLSGAIDELESTATLGASGELADVSLRQAWLASRTVSGINAEFSGSGDINWKSDFSLRVSALSLKMGQARLDVVADIRRTGSETRAKVDISVPLAACDALIDSLPTGLAPLASQVKLEGTLALQAGIVFDTAHPKEIDAKWDLSNGCRVRGSTAQVAPERFREPFILEVPDARGVMVERAFGPGTPNWVPLSSMTTHLPDAVLVCEDGRFFGHSGFDSQAIRNSIKDNLLRGRFMRGGSTVSMQLAKNLYLRREKTVSRKLQEAALTLLLEQSFSKNDLMELYLNVVELGPGVYGVGEASRFYFDTTPAALSPTQAFYLASVLPNPKALHFAPDGKVSRGWLSQIRRLMIIANSRHYLTDEELHQSLEEDLHFGSSEGNRPPPAAMGVEPAEQVPDGATDG